MIFSAAEQVSHLSGIATLHPGDIVLTGTPAGVGAGRNEFLQPGDHVELEIEGLGRLEHWIG
jgi:2-keto-4-pentenoate hydratase/2-oxohepta-3-ene-1,7-dioic acid hydratase in catechol pathway